MADGWWIWWSYGATRYHPLFLHGGGAAVRVPLGRGMGVGGLPPAQAVTAWTGQQPRAGELHERADGPSFDAPDTPIQSPYFFATSATLSSRSVSMLMACATPGF
jgi:hypothetical protein